MKVAKFVPMMRAQGCRVILYGPDEILCEPDEHVVITTEADRLRWGYGGPDGYDTTKPFIWDAAQPYWHEANTKAIDAIRERIPGDRRGHFLCLITGTQWPIANEISGTGYINPIVVEWGVGYEGVFSPFCAYESYAWMHHVYGLRKTVDGVVFDQVIPNFFDASQFYVPKKPSKDYLLFMGRLIPRKGVDVAVEIARRVGMPLKLAGHGGEFIAKGKIMTAEGMILEGKHIDYVGHAGFAERAELMGNAAAVIVPTKYIEPFGGVAVEAMLAGAPVITSDWGSFTEIVTPDVGRRFRTIRQGAEAVGEMRKVSNEYRRRIRRAAMKRYSLEAVGPMFTRWFDQLDTLWGKGFYE